MANARLTDKPELTTPDDNDFLYIIDISDTTESAQGTSKKIRKSNITPIISGKEDVSNKQNSLAIDGTGTKYPTVDAVNAIDLQKVIDTGGFGSFNVDGKSQEIYFLNDGELSNTAFAFSSDWIDNGNGMLAIDNNSCVMSQADYVSQKTGHFSVNSGVAEIMQISFALHTKVKFETPTLNSTLNFPAKTVAGVYTLATTDETVNLTGDQTINGSKTFEIGNEVSAVIINGDTSSTGYALQIKDNNSITGLINKGGTFFGSAFIKTGGTSTQALMANGSAVQLVTQTITNGVTDKSPSEDAVFDALALKANTSSPTFTGLSTFVGNIGSVNSFEIRNGNANGSLLIGADVNSNIKTNAVRKIARITTPSFSDVTKNHQIFAADFDEISTSKIYFGGTNGSTQLGCTEINFVTVTTNGDTGGNTAMQVRNTGNVLIGTTVDSGNKLKVNGDILSTQYKLSALNTAPTSATATGTLGEVRITATYIYVCTATNTWVRTALTTW